MRNFLSLTLAFILLSSLLAGQDAQIEKGAYYCSHKKSTSDRPLRELASPNTPRHHFDVQNYTLNFDLYTCFQSPYSQAFDATATVTFRVDTALNQIKLNAVNNSLSITGVGLAGSSFSHTDDTLTIDLDRTYNPDEIVDVFISYSHFDVEDGHFYANNGFIFTDNEPEGARCWFPCYDKPSDKATVDITAKVPSTVLLGSNGRLADSTTIADTTWFHWISRDPVATYLTVLSAKVNWNLDIVYWDRPSTPGDPMPIRFYYNNGENPFAMQEKVPQMADWFTEYYGEHPFEKDGFATLNSEFTWGGMENQTLTSLCPGCWGESLICHEFAHQWFGDMISPGTWADLWLNEGFATWSESLWWERDGGYQAYKSDVNNNASIYLGSNPGWAVYNPEWAVTTPPLSVMFNYAITYCKSSCMLHLLRYSLGDELFFPAIYDYATDTVDFKYKNATTDDFRAKLEESTGKDLEWFFESWVKQPNHPIYHNEYTFHDNGNGTWDVNFLVNQVQDNAPFFPIPIELSIYFEDSSDTTIRVMSEENQQVFTFTFDKEPAVMFFDLRNEIVIKQATLSVGIEEDNIGNQAFRLEQNFPNPASSQTTFTYSVPQNGMVSLSVYDMTGKMVKELVNEVQSKGTHILTADLSHLRSGVYFYTLYTGEQSLTKRMAIID